MLQSGVPDDINGVYFLQMDVVIPGDQGSMMQLFFSVSPPSGVTITKPRRLSRRPIADSAKSDESLKMIRGWISDCSEHHKECTSKEASFAPTRLLKVELGASLNKQVIQLVENIDDYPVQYAALSHCWGPPNAQQPMLRTMRATLNEFKSGIAINRLPQNFQDAVTMTRLLDLPYIWIDSLCIVQDSHEDWAREAALMAQVYSRAAVTLTATSAASSHEGFLRPRSRPEAHIPYLVQGYRDSGEMLFVQQAEKDDYLDRWERDVEMSCWNKRGWTLQESVLSKRMLHFCDTRLCFACNHHRCTEDNGPVLVIPRIKAVDLSRLNFLCLDSPHKSPSSDGSSDTDTLSQDGSDIGLSEEDLVKIRYSPFSNWYFVIMDYCERQLSYSQDKLPAISGLAKRMEGLPINAGSYMAGIWEGDLAFA
ncbi:heterokaryon incompatibility protein-domain-containing protein [Bombardia bombarda]|uniref:Heterokaryon incompatibility protein-domain-containing protein n=1 Tax=Bombardia bombarda TaxID=252184 RepID=A0AA39WLT9_9PEZI|nr:heterokaryon incompatibility protein-domain-containing protein [Bombardia bombarda]